jgi:O-antigen/teichoic acid export membrane protein
VADLPPESSPGRQAGERALANTAFRAVGEIVGKLASLLLFAVLAREVGASNLGDFVFAFAWAQIAMTPVGLGVDRYLLRKLAADRPAVGDFLFNALFLKLTRSIPVVMASVAAINVLGYDSQTRAAVYVLTAGLLLDTLARTIVSVFNAFERGGLVATGIVIQRFGAAALGLAALAAGFGVVAVCVAFTIGTALRLATSVLFLVRHIGVPAPRLPVWARKELRSRSTPFALQDIFGLILGRIDVVILSFFASDAAVGIYGSAYRLFEATAFLSSALVGAFSAMYTYLGPDTRPTVRTVFGRSIKLALCLLVPCGVAYGLLAEPICRLFFGAALESAAEPLRILAPVVVLYGLLVLGNSLIVSRRDPKLLVGVIGAGALLNLVLNLALAPGLEENGAALAMLLSEILLAGAVLAIAIRTVDGIDAVPAIAAPGLAGLAMAGPLLVFQEPLWAAVLVAGASYVLAYVVVDRRVSPGDLELVRDMISRRIRPRRQPPGTAPEEMPSLGVE